ncbi:MAG: pyridoxamine 5'-phosphate oxidase family protein [Dehalococcoidia bacterium]|nr:pyridoxamine 5'-phosphate oxidase family protein [Dehalococcoidia bacterium]
MHWSEFCGAAPELSRLAEGRFAATGLALLGTVTASGEARISPLEPVIADGRLYLGMMWQSKKALDLLRDGRCLVHSVVADKDGSEGEVKLRGRVAEVTDAGERDRFAEASFQKTDFRPPEPYHLFALDIERASFVKYSGEGHQTVMRWRVGAAEKTKVRRWTGAGYVDA